jgi:hypothetical protein
VSERILLMNISNLKSAIISKVSSLNDEKLLEEINRILDLEVDLVSSYILSLEEKKSIEKGLEDIHENRVYSTEQAEKLLREWLGK